VEYVFPVAAHHFAVPVARLETLFWQWRTSPAYLQAKLTRGQASLKSATVLCATNDFAQLKKYYLISFM